MPVSLISRYGRISWLPEGSQQPAKQILSTWRRLLRCGRKPFGPRQNLMFSSTLETAGGKLPIPVDQVVCRKAPHSVELMNRAIVLVLHGLRPRHVLPGKERAKQIFGILPIDSDDLYAHAME